MRLAWTLLALVSLAACPARADKKLDQAVAKAEAQLAKGKDAEAVKILQKAVAQAPRDAEAPLALMSLFTRLGRRDEAAAALATAGERAGTAPPAVRARVRSLQSALALREGSASDALAFAEEAVAASAGAESLSALARAQARLGLAAARATADRAVAAGPDSARGARGERRRPARGSARRGGRGRLPAGGRARSPLGRGGSRPAHRRPRAGPGRQEGGGRCRRPAGLLPRAEEPAREARARPGLREPGPARRGPNGLRRGRGARPDLAVAAHRRPGRPTAPGRHRRGSRLAARAPRGVPGDRRGGAAPRPGAREEGGVGGGPPRSRPCRGPAARAGGGAGAGGEAAYAAGELARAAEAYGRAVVLDPANLAYRTSHALHLGYDGRREEAVAALLEVTAKPEGQTAEAWMALGGIYRSFEPARVAEAVAAYEKALKLDPKNGQAAMGVARSYRAGRQWARAIAAYERVSGAFPRLDREALLGTAWCYQLSGDDTRARFYTGLAARAGADVEPLRRALSREGATADDFERAELGRRPPVEERRRPGSRGQEPAGARPARGALARRRPRARGHEPRRARAHRRRPLSPRPRRARGAAAARPPGRGGVAGPGAAGIGGGESASRARSPARGRPRGPRAKRSAAAAWRRREGPRAAGRCRDSRDGRRLFDEPRRGAGEDGRSQAQDAQEDEGGHERAVEDRPHGQVEQGDREGPRRGDGRENRRPPLRVAVDGPLNSGGRPRPATPRPRSGRCWPHPSRRQAPASRARGRPR